MKKPNNQEKNQSEKDKKHFSKLIGMPFRNPGSTTAVSAAARAPQCPKKQTLEFYNAYLVEMKCPQKEMDIFI